jgi:hypothetical protein
MNQILNLWERGKCPGQVLNHPDEFNYCAPNEFPCSYYQALKGELTDEDREHYLGKVLAGVVSPQRLPTVLEEKKRHHRVNSALVFFF